MPLAAESDHARASYGQNIRPSEDQFGLMVPRDVMINVHPTWGVSELRHDVYTTAPGDSLQEVDGEIEVKTDGSDGSGEAILQTKERGQEMASALGEAGIGLRIPTSPTGSQEWRAGYFDDTNGAGMGEDDTGLYVFRQSSQAQSEQLIRQADWNLDPLDGSGPSGYTVDLADGAVLKVRFDWYGKGELEWALEVPFTGDTGLPINTNRAATIPVHRETYKGELVFTDPNQPIRCKVMNGGTASSLAAYVTDMQFSILGGGRFTPQRPVPDFISDHTLNTSQGNWEPLITFRRKDTYNGRPNSVRAVFKGAQISANARCEMRVTYNDDSSASTVSWGDPTDWPSSETGLETRLQNDAGDHSVTPGVPVKVAPVLASIFFSDMVEVVDQIPLGNQTEITLWARPMTTSDTDILFASLILDEQH